MNAILDIHLQATPLRTGPPEPTSPHPRGSFAGIPITVSEGTSILTDAAEEVGLHLSERIDRRHHAGRTAAAARPPRVLSLERINDYLQKSHQARDPQELASLVRSLLKGRDAGAPHLESGDPRAMGPTERYMLLQHALQTGPSALLPRDVLEQVEEALAELETQADVLIRADLATIDQAAAYGESAREIAQFQESLHAILGKPTLGQAFKESLALARENGSRLEAAVTHLMDALGACLAGCGAASEKALLETLVGELYHLKCINTLFHDARSVIRNFRRRHPTGPRQSESGDESVD